MQVKAWEEKISIPTYKVGNPDKNPMFLEKRVYQGSSGKVYPHAVIDKVFSEKQNKEYKALFLENEYLKIMILPELGGRIQMALDKTNDYHFVYYNQVIKPALVGLTGPWISGGIEFNWPQHHRPSTMDPIDYLIMENSDGSKTIWVSEIEKMFGTKGMAGFTLYPGKAYLELKGKLFNRTEIAQTFLWWANPAVHVDEYYQSVFPPDVTYVFDHGRRDVSSFPIATGTYYKVDYSPGTDISKYCNIPVPTSYMAVDSKFNFLGGYHSEKQAGILIVADHHVSPGKKQWTWGCGEFGKMWDKNLTDEDGPYFELMAGVFTDNQPDFSFIMPGEERTFEQYFMPYKKIGKVKNATIDAAVNLEIDKNAVLIKVYATSHFSECQICLFHNNKIIFSYKSDLSPVKIFEQEIKLEEDQLNGTFKVNVESNIHKTLVSYELTKNQEKKDIPEPAKPIIHPKDIKSNDALFLAGLHLEQYRHANFKPEDYYNEALKRDPEDVRCNNALGMLFYRKGNFEKAEKLFRKSINAITRHNPNPFDGEPLHNLGLCLKMMHLYAESFDFFYKSCWNSHWQDNSYFQMAQIKSIEKNLEDALLFSEKSLIKNSHNFKNRHLKAIILRKLEKFENAVSFVKETINLDPFDFGSRNELYLLLNLIGDLDKSEEELKIMLNLMRNNENTFLEISNDYAKAGFYQEAIELLSKILGKSENPLVDYYLSYFEQQLGNNDSAKEHAIRGLSKSPDRIFPNKLDDINVLKTVILMNPMDFKVLYYLGNLYYDKQEYEKAIECWERSVLIEKNFPQTHRNLGIAYFNKRNDVSRAVEHLEIAFKINSNDSRILYELDQLYKKLGKDVLFRLEFLEKYQALVEERDDLSVEKITLLNINNVHSKAYEILTQRIFHPWEGGEGKASGQYIITCIEIAKNELDKGDFKKALEFLEKAKTYPENLGEGKLYQAKENDIDFFIGLCYENLHQTDLANKYYQMASEGNDDPAPAIFYNDQPPEKIFYQGWAWKKMNNINNAEKKFKKLIIYGEKHSDDNIEIDFFAVSLPDMQIFNDDLNLKNTNHCNFMMGLGYLGLGEKEKSKKYLLNVFEKDKAHQGAYIHLKLLEKIYILT